MLRVFIDSNVIISAILFPKSIVAKALNLAIERYQIIMSQYVIKEIEDVFTRKFPDDLYALKKFLNNLKYELLYLSKMDYTKYPKMRDKNDIPILAGAIVASADILITGDKDFENVKIKKPQIMTPSSFWNKYK